MYIMARIKKTAVRVPPISRRLNPAAYGDMRCKGRTPAGYRCNRKTNLNLLNGLCCHHDPNMVKATSIYSYWKAEETRIRCKGYNNKGLRCKRYNGVSKDTEYCFQHDPNRKEHPVLTTCSTEEYFRNNTLDLNEVPDSE
jgi:hypothetical protein